MRIHSTSFIATAFVLTACASTPDAVPVIAEPAQIIALAGTWEGSYEAREGEGRSGQVHFSLAEGRDTASGYVIMTFVPRGAARVPRPLRGVYPAAPRSEQLAIAFVRAADGLVTGELAPYTDPACGCRLQTVSPASNTETGSPEHLRRRISTRTPLCAAPGRFAVCRTEQLEIL